MLISPRSEYKSSHRLRAKDGVEEPVLPFWPNFERLCRLCAGLILRHRASTSDRSLRTVLRLAIAEAVSYTHLRAHETDS